MRRITLTGNRPADFPTFRQMVDEQNAAQRRCLLALGIMPGWTDEDRRRAARRVAASVAATACDDLGCDDPTCDECYPTASAADQSDEMAQATRLASCYHEAGHVMAVLTVAGIMPDEAFVSKDGTSGGTRWYPYTERLSNRELLEIGLAGPIAEAKLLGQTYVVGRTGNQSDEAKIAERLGKGWNNSWGFLTAVQDVERFTNRDWKGIQRVARRLFTAGRLDQSQLRAILKGAK